MVATVPVETFGLGVGAILVLDPVIKVDLVERLISFEYRIFFNHLLGASAAVRKLPGTFRSVHIIFYMLNVFTSLEHDHFQSFFCKLFCRPAAADIR